MVGDKGSERRRGTGRREKPIRVAHVATVDLSLRYLLLNQMVSIQRAGFRVYGISSPGKDISSIEAAGICHIPVPMTRNFTPLADLHSLWRLWRVMRRGRFTIVHTHNPKPGLLGQIAARLAGVPIVVNTLHGFYFHEGTPLLWRRFYILTERIAARCSDVILSQNREDIATAVREGIASPTKLRWLGNGIDIRRFDRERLSAEDVAAARQAIGLSQDSVVVGFVGRLVREKGILDLLAAARLIRERIPHAHFLFVGPADPDKGDAVAPEVAEEFGITDVCHFVGMRQDMPEMYALMDVFVLPSYREGFPRAPMEASAMEVPCVVTDIRGCREAVKPGHNGLLVPAGDSEALASAVASLLSDPDRRRTMGRNGRQLAVEQFDEEIVFSRVRSEYTRLFTARGIPSPQEDLL